MTRVLIIDDSPVIRKVARRIFQQLNFGVSEADNGQDGLDMCGQSMPDGILLDWNMPVMDGYEFIRRLRSMPEGDKPKVVFCTTENEVGHLARAMHAGADEYMMKPFDRDMLVAKFAEVGLA